MTKAALLAALIAGLQPGSSSAAPSQPAPGAEQVSSERRQVFEQVWREVGERYYDPRFNGVDWNAVGVKYRPRIASVNGDAEFHALLRAMLGELRDAHTRILSPSQARDRAAGQATSAGVILFEVEGRPVVFQVRPGSPAAEAGLAPGVRVLEVGGVPVAEALRRERAEAGPSSSERASLVLTYLGLISGPAAEPLHLKLARADGTEFEVRLARRPLDKAPRFESRILPSGDLYVSFDRFRAPVAKLFRAALERSRGARGLILDLRSNTGGDGKEGTRTIAPLLAAPTLVARLATRTGKPPSALGGLVTLPLRLMAGKTGGRIFAGPLVILTNEGTGSTSEVIAASLQERGRARVVGARSCGCALGVLRHRRLADGSSLAISEVGLLSGLGRRIEGEGVRPDVPVALRLADFQQGRDLVLEAGVAELGRMADEGASRPAP
jgi:carboxyl-terminal processing protease